MGECRHAYAASGVRKSDDNFWELVLTAQHGPGSSTGDEGQTNIQKDKRTENLGWVGCAGSETPTIQPRDSVSL